MHGTTNDRQNHHDRTLIGPTLFMVYSVRMASPRLPLIVSIALGIFLLPEFANAQTGGAAGLAAFINNFILGNGIVILQGLAAGFMFYYGFRMVTESGNESAIGNARKSFIYALTGFAVLAAGSQIRTALFLGSNSTTNPIPFEPTALADQINQLGVYLVQASQGILLIMFVFAAFRLITSGGDESAATNARKNMVHYGAAAIIMMTSTTLVRAFFYPSSVGNLIIDIAGVIRFAMGFLGAFSVIALIIAGIMLILSVDESLKDRARQTIIGTLASLLIALFSFAILTAVINGLQAS